MKQQVTRPGRWLALAVLVLAVLLVAVDATVLGLATPFLSEDLQPSGNQLLWIGDAYSFVLAGLLVSMGSLGDRIGRKRILLIGATAFGAISVLNAYASSAEVMILARALLGVAGATLMPATLALIRNLFHDPRERSLAIGIWGAAASAGMAIARHGFGWVPVAAAVAGAIALYGFVRRQRRLPIPLLDLSLFRSRGFSSAVLADLLTILGLSGLIFFLSQYLQLVQGLRPIEAGLAELPAAIGSIVAGLLAGRVARRFSVRAVVAGGLAAIGLALAALTTISADTGYPLLGTALLAVGAGAGLSFTVTADVILAAVPKEEAGAASAVSETAYELGAALGIALLGSIVTGVYRNFTGPAGTPEAAHESLGGAVEAAAQLPPQTAAALLDAARESFAHGVSIAAGVGAVVLLATAVAAWFLLRGQRLGTER